MYSMSTRTWNDIAGPCLLGQETGMEEDFPENGKFLSICIYIWDLLRSFKVCSDDKERVGRGKQQEATAPIHP